MAYCTGWTIPHIRDELDLPTLAALREQWEQFPPLPVMVAHYLGAAKPKKTDKQAESLDEQDAIPTTKLSEGDFNALLASMGLPTSPPPPTAAAP